MRGVCTIARAKFVHHQCEVCRAMRWEKFLARRRSASCLEPPASLRSWPNEQGWDRLPAATTPDDFRVHTVPLGLVTGKTYEIAIFGANRQPPESNFQITLTGNATKRSVCKPD
jgi:hypothetical protein